MTTEEILATAQPRPWSIDEQGEDDIRDAQGDLAVSVQRDSRTQATRELVVLAVNAYEAGQRKIQSLTDALKDARSMILLAVNTYEADQRKIRALTEALKHMTAVYDECYCDAVCEEGEKCAL